MVSTKKMGKHQRFFSLSSALACFTVIFVLCVGNLSSGPSVKSIFRKLQNAPADKRGLLPDETLKANLFKQALQCLVFVDVYSQKPALVGIGNKKKIEVLNGLGSGYVWDKLGHIVTNSHVIEDATSAECSFYTKQNVEAANSKLLPTSNTGSDPSVDGYHWRVAKCEVVGVDKANDIAVLKVADVPPSELKPVQLGSSKSLQVGQHAYAIGNPYGLDHSMSHGIISALNRLYESPDGHVVKGCIQTDAAINPGNSGGILLDSSGKFIGMNTAGYSQGGGDSSGVGIAINVDRIKLTVGKLLKNGGKIVRPFFGATFMDHVQAYLGIHKGVLLMEIAEGGPAAKAGLKGTAMDEATGNVIIGDVITVIGNKEVQTELGIEEEIENFDINGQVKVKYIRFPAEGNPVEKETVQLVPSA